MTANAPAESTSTQPSTHEYPLEGWCSLRLGELAVSRKGKRPRRVTQEPCDSVVPYIDIQTFESGKPHKYAEPESSTIVDQGDILVVWDGARCGLVGRAPVAGALGSTLVTLEPLVIDSRYLVQFLRSCFDAINSNPRGSGIQHVEPELFWNLEIPVPPLAEQKRISAKVEELLARANVAQARLAKVPDILKRFRQSVLAAACSGRLTADWRENRLVSEDASKLLESVLAERLRAYEQECNKARKSGKRLPKKPANMERSDLMVQDPLELIEIPPEWTWVSVSDVANRVQYGTSVKADANASSGVPVIRMGNIQEGELDLSHLKYIDSNNKEIDAVMIEKGDILFNRTNSPELVGKSAVFDRDLKAVFASYLIRLRCDDRLAVGKYVCWWINSPWGRWWARTVRTDGVSQSNINASRLAAMPLPLPPLAEQREIVRRVDALFDLADAIGKRVAAATAHAEKLRQTILARAFRGELVPTEAELARREGRDYEPASVILERIRADRQKHEATKPKPRRGRRRKA